MGHVISEKEMCMFYLVFVGNRFYRKVIQGMGTLVCRVLLANPRGGCEF